MKSEHVKVTFSYVSPPPLFELFNKNIKKKNFK